jgi:mono/diheme cytochrome c family protein
MYNQPKKKPLAESEFFKDGTSARPIPANAVAREDLVEDVALFTGLVNGVYVTQLPIALTPQLLRRGRERFNIHCAVCHRATGDGDGTIVERGFPRPPSFHLNRLRNAPIGHFYDVITNGYGVMYAYASRIEPADRWAISAYIRALQLSHNAQPGDVPLDEASKLAAQP